MGAGRRIGVCGFAEFQDRTVRDLSIVEVRQSPNLRGPGRPAAHCARGD